MINRELLKSARMDAGLTQAEVANRTRKMFGVGSQQGYRKIESGEAKESKHLPYYCHVLGIKLSEAGVKTEGSYGDTDAEAEALFTAIESLSKEKQLELALAILNKFHA